VAKQKGGQQPVNPLVLGIVVGIILTLFCMFCLDAWALDNRLDDSELEAWEERQWREEWERREKE